MQNPETDESSSDDECLASLKRKVAEKRNLRSDKRKKQDDNGEEYSLIPSVFVKVEVEEVNEEEEAEETAIDYSISRSTQDKRKCNNTNRHYGKKDLKPRKRKKTVLCQDCDMVFNSGAELRQHAIVHQVETRHKCDECGRCFSKAFGLRTHKRMHGDKNFKCPLCDARFTQQINLGRHLSYHEKKEKCERCEELFHTKDMLEEHICEPDKEKPKPRPRKNYKEPLVYPETKPEQPFKIASRTPLEENNFKILRNDEKGLETSTSSIINGMDSEDSMDNKESSRNGFELISKKEDLSYPTQCAIVNKMHKGRSVSDICQIYNLIPEVVNEIWEDRDEFVSLKKAGRNSVKYMNSVLDARILEWFNRQKAKDVQVTGKMLMDIAEAFAKETGFIAFNGSKKWLDRFKTKYHITFRGTPKRDYAVMNECKWKNQFLREQWQDARHGMSDEEIYTADEVGLYYNPSRGRIKKLAGKKYIHGFAKDRLAIFLCTNVTGRDKKKLLVCGTEDPLMHSYRSPDTLPVTYIRHAQAHFTTTMFEEFVKFWNRELQFQNKKAVLILDRATIHSKLTLSNLKLCFVPWKASNSLMPIKNGIFNAFREQYRKLLLQEKTMNVLRGVDRNLTCLEALNLLEKAWDRTPCEVITRCFVETGYDIDNDDCHKDVEIPKVTDNDDEMMCKVLEEYDVESYFLNTHNLDNYVTVDEEFLTGLGTNGSVFGGNHRSHDIEKQQQKEIAELLPIATDRPETDEVEDSVVKSRAAEDLEIVRRYLQINKTSFETYCRFMDIEKFVVNCNPPSL